MILVITLSAYWTYIIFNIKDTEMKKYRIDYTFSKTYEIDIVAENESEAIKIFHKNKNDLGGDIIFKDIVEV